MGSDADAGLSASFLIVGAGPAGASAAIMSESIALDFVLIEDGPIGGRLRWIPDVTNVPGVRSGLAMADTLADQLRSLRYGKVVPGRVVAVHAERDCLRVALADGRQAECDQLLWSTGLGLRSRRDSPLIIDDGAFEELFLIGPNFPQIADEPKVTVLGCDRPLGSLLRDQPTMRSPTVIVFPGEEYKVPEITELRDDLVMLYSRSVSVLHYDELRVDLVDGGVAHISDSMLVTNLGSCPNVAPLAELVRFNSDGFVAEIVDRRIVLAGDVAHPSHQRISVAVGDGARAALDRYYQRSGLYQTA